MAVLWHDRLGSFLRLSLTMLLLALTLRVVYMDEEASVRQRRLLLYDGGDDAVDWRGCQILDG